jgi:phosphatidylinositol alpha-mannosyltransferase
LSGRLLARAFRHLSRRLLPRFDLVLTPSDSPKTHLMPGPGQEIIAFPPCTDLRPFRAAAPLAAFRDGRINILFLGRLEPRKGAMLALMAYHKLCGSGLPVRLIVAGGGPQEAALRDYVRAQGVAHVEFVGAPDETAPLFASADIFCAPSPYGESFGIVLVEAMAAGKPVVAAANSGYSTVLTGAAADFLVKPGSVEALAAVLEMLARNGDLRARLGAWGREAAMGYDCRALAPSLVMLYEAAISRFKARTGT